MHGDFMIFINLTHFFGLYLVVVNPCVSAKKFIFLAEQFGVDIKSRLQPVFIQYLNESLILSNRIIITESNRFHFSVEHKPSPIFINTFP